MNHQDFNHREMLSQIYDKYAALGGDDELLALEYARTWWSQRDFFNCSTVVAHSVNRGFVPGVDVDQLQNVALLTPRDSLSYYAKRSLLLADKVLLYSPSDSERRPYPIASYEDPYPPNVSAQTSIDYTAFLNIADIRQLGRFLQENKELILSERVAYIPDITVDVHTDTYWDGSCHTRETPSRDMLEQLITWKDSASGAISRRFVEDLYLRAVAEIEIPYFDGQNSAAVLRMIEEHEYELSNLRNRLKRCFLELYGAEGSGSFDFSIKKIGLDIQDGIKEIRSEMKKLHRHVGFQVGSGLAIGTVVATLVAISGTVVSSNTIAQLLTYLGTGGGIISMSKFLEEYLNKKQDITEKPFYFFWLFHKK